MRRHVAAAAAALAVGLLAGCSHTIEGSVAMTTEPRPGPAADALTMKCSEYSKLDTDDKVAVIEAIMEEQGAGMTSESASMMQILVDTMCQFLPTMKVTEVLVGMPPP
jgi:hypothetical protein